MPKFSFKKTLANLLPPALLSVVQHWRRPSVRRELRRIEKRRLEKCYRYDIERFWKYCPGARLILATPSEGGASEAQLSAMITIQYHALEKGLSHPAPRPGFGRAKAQKLCELIEEFISLFGFKEIVDVSLDALHSYARHAAADGSPNLALEQWLARINTLGGRAEKRIANATLATSRAGIQSLGKIDLFDFFQVDTVFAVSQKSLCAMKICEAQL